MKYYLSLAIIVVMGLAFYQEKPVEAPVEAKPSKPVIEPVGAKETVGAEFEPPAASF